MLGDISDQRRRDIFIVNDLTEKEEIKRYT